MSNKISKKWTYDNVRNADAKTMKRLHQDAKQGNADAQYLLERLAMDAEELARRKEIMDALRKTAENRRNVEIEKYRLTAEQGDAEAQYQIGLVYCQVFHEQAVDDTFIHLRPELQFELPPDEEKALQWIQKAAKQGHPQAQEWVKREQREKLVKRLQDLAGKYLPCPSFMGASCYVIRPPSPVEIMLYSLFEQLGKKIANRFTHLWSRYKKFSEQPTPEEYQVYFSLLQEAGWKVSYGVNEKQKKIMVFHFPSNEDIILDPIPDISTLEAIVRYLEDDRSVTIEEIKRMLEKTQIACS